MTTATDITIPFDEPYAREVLVYALVDEAARVAEEAGASWDLHAPAKLLIFGGPAVAGGSWMELFEKIGRIGAALRTVLDEGADELDTEGLLDRGPGAIVGELRDCVTDLPSAYSDEARAELAAAVVSIRKFIERYLPETEAVT